MTLPASNAIGRVGDRMSAPPPPSGSAPAPPAVMLIDDHDLFRAGLRTLLEKEGMRVVGDMRCDGAAADMVRRTRPTVVIVDALTANGEGTQAIIQTITTPPKQHVDGDPEPVAGVLPPPTPAALVFSRATTAGDLYRCIRAGARGYLPKDATVADLATAIRTLHTGWSYLTPKMTHMALHFLRSGRMPLISRTEMSERELDVLRLVAQGLDNNDVAASLGISAKTVKNHVSAIFVKLGLTNRVQAAVYAVRTGIV